MRLYKLTDKNYLTRAGELNETKWGEGVTHKATGEGTKLCTSDVIHAYTSPLLAVLMNPVHADIKDPILWEAEGEIIAAASDKVGVKELTTIRIIPLPKITQTQKIAFGILAALEVYEEESFKLWAENWLSGRDRSSESARKVELAAQAAAVWTKAADAAMWAAAARAAWAAVAAHVAADAAIQGTHLDLQMIAEKAMSY